MESYGIIVEGQYDAGVYEELIRKICADAQVVKVRETGGKSQLMRKFPALLHTFEHEMPTGSVDKAMVIRDADCGDAAAIENKMRDSISGRRYSFPGGVGFHAVKQETETWLLADPNAINKVAASRGGKPVSPVPDSLEDLQDPKEKIRSVLSRSGLNYTPQVCREIAKETDLARLRIRCPSFIAFEQKVIDP